LLALADQFGMGAGGLVEEAKAILPRLTGRYEQAYYAGIISERLARQQLAQGHPGAASGAYEHLCDAMELYEQAEELAADGDDDAILRYNTCVRMIERQSLSPQQRDEQEQPLE
jgi:hypothetical protein